MKGHNFGTCKKCGKEHPHPRGNANKKLSKEGRKKLSLVHGGTGGELIEKTCGWCKKPFAVKYRERKRQFCSKSCAVSFRNNSGNTKWNSKESHSNQSESLKEFYKTHPERLEETKEQLSQVRNHRNHKPAWSKTPKPSKEEMNKKYGKMGELNSMYGKPPPHGSGRGKQGYREDIGHFVRSCWEANVARVLKFRKIKYLYEPEVFHMTLNNGVKTTYTPDFYLHGNVYIEVKGYMDDVHEMKVSEFKKHHTLLLLSKKEYEIMLKTYKNEIEFEDYRNPKITSGRDEY